MRFVTIFLGLFLATGTYAAALPPRELGQAVAARAEQYADKATVKLDRGEEETADEDVTWNVKENYTAPE